MIGRAAAILTCLSLAASRLRAQEMNIGPEFLVNTYTTGPQGLPAVAAAPDGSFVVVWGSTQPADDSAGVFGQRFSANGVKIGSEFLVNTYTTDSQTYPAIAMDSHGRFAVVWESLRQDGSSFGVYGQRYDATGAPLGGEFQVNTTTTGAQRYPAIAMAPDGAFVVVWSDVDYRPESDVWGQVFDASGAKTGGEFRVNTSTPYAQSGAAVAADAAGRFVVVWTTHSKAGGGTGILGQSFDAAGGKIGSEFPVNTPTGAFVGHAAITMDRAENFVVVWYSTGKISGQSFNSGAERIGGEFAVDTFTGVGDDPQVAFERDGGLFAAWESNGEIAARRFDRTGVPREPKFILNTTSDGVQGRPAIAAAPAGVLGFWDSAVADGSSDGVIGRRQRLEPIGLLADAHGNGSTDENGVIEPGEAVRIEPSWRNRGPGIANLDGNVQEADFQGPAGPTYSVFDGVADYPTLLVGFSAACNENPDPCYGVQVIGTRPKTHWDATLREHLSVQVSQVWTLHIGDSFTDVPRSQPFYKKIETLLHNNVTTGCSKTQYCPDSVVSRDAMAIFVAKSIAGAGELVPSAGQVGASAYSCKAGGHSLFTDVAPTDSFCKHVHYLANRNVTLGCFGTNYCPAVTITRDAMASFIAKAIVAPGGGAAVPASYTDPTTSRSYSCVSGSANLHFTDVPVSNAFCKHIHFLWAKGIVEGCSATTYCPGDPVARDAMAKFIANGFGLKLYQP